MRRSTKFIAIACALVMVACTFCTTLPASAEDSTNLLLGASYTVTGNVSETLADTDNKLIADGAYRGDGTNNFSGASGVAGVTLEYTGSNASTVIEFTFDEAINLDCIVVKRARCFFLDNNVNRHCNVANIEVTSDGVNYNACDFTSEYIAVDGAPEAETADKAQTGPQYFDIKADIIGAKGITGLKVTLNTQRSNGTSAYVCQFDEIEGYANAQESPSEESSSEEPSSEEPSSEEPSSEEPSSEEPSSEDNDDTPIDTGDVGMIAFAVLAVVSGAAVAVLRKKA